MAMTFRRPPTLCSAEIPTVQMCTSTFPFCLHAILQGDFYLVLVLLEIGLGNSRLILSSSLHPSKGQTLCTVFHSKTLVN